MAGLVHRIRFRRDHRWSLAHMSEGIDGDLDAQERARLRGHADECPDCERVLVTLGELVRQLRDLRGRHGHSVAEDMLERVRRELADGR